MRSSSGFTYRPDIDGLRAVAILAVIAFHTVPGWFPGGFVGVDVFFVISGYLISGILLRDLQRGTFSFLGFYGRRIRRIFPALLVVLAAVWVIGWLRLLPEEYERLGKHMAASAGFVANIVFYKEAGYFDTAAELKPLLHLWSLGIEEQFYILWPLLLFVTWRFRKWQLPVLCALACFSFTVNVVSVSSRPDGAFFLPQARFWELTLGALLARAELREGRPLIAWQHTRWLEALACLGTTLLTLAVATIDRTRLFPGWWALLPAAGSLLLIAAGPGTWINRHLLGNRAMVLVGLISYPLYLWHWPLLSLARIVDGENLSPTIALCAVSVSVVLASLTYRFIELPVQSYRPKERVVAPLVAGVFAMGLVGFATLAEAIPPRSAAFGLDRVLRASAERAYPRPHLKRVDAHNDWLMKQGDAPQEVLFFGDSNMAQYYPRVDQILTADPRHTKSVVFASLGGCPPIPGVRERHHPACDGFVRRTEESARSRAIDTIVVSAGWYGYFVDPDPRYSYYFQDADFSGPITLGSEGSMRAFKAFEKMIRSFVQKGKRVYIILQIPVDSAIDPHQMVKRGLLDLSFTLETQAVDRARTVATLDPIDSVLRHIGQDTGAITLDPLEALCTANVCPTVNADGEPIYLDGGHLRPSYVRDHIRFLDDVLRIPE